MIRPKFVCRHKIIDRIEAIMVSVEESCMHRLCNGVFGVPDIFRVQSPIEL